MGVSRGWGTSTSVYPPVAPGIPRTIPSPLPPSALPIQYWFRISPGRGGPRGYGRVTGPYQGGGAIGVWIFLLYNPSPSTGIY